ncbi:MAG TPA: hypothetical protein VKP78_05150 [bacterium]|nr:hypothetical protein [bacterium]
MFTKRGDESIVNLIYGGCDEEDVIVRHSSASGYDYGFFTILGSR